ncbi:metal-dependent hydrolase [Arthrobacter mobilis]|uniref:Metal-dependent hydrolase n=1 Tax=Arthrobacter mobilis TaxID=2724944 RepID=A0A7X6HF20_9MICC|nr:metal-dependent hydrolase [Arthrobacter mobilis]NKX55969.1 metal-dependent hydrolase [Arthrobacter mobilis]
MMGAHHAACGAAAWVALTSQAEVSLAAVQQNAPWLPDSLTLGMGLLDLSPMGIITGALVCAGAALVPDADHHNATIAHSLPPLSNVVCGAIGKVSGGHRHGTHSILGVIAFVAVAFVAGLWVIDTDAFGAVYAGAGILTVLLTAFAAKALKLMPDRLRKTPWAVGIFFGAFIALFGPEDQGWFVFAMGVGVIVHILGDMMTTGGCNLVWPLSIKPPKAVQKIPFLNRIWQRNGYVSFPVLGNAGSVREWFLLIPISLYAAAGVIMATVDMGQTGVENMMAMF